MGWQRAGHDHDARSMILFVSYNEHSRLEYTARCFGRSLPGLAPKVGYLGVFRDFCATAENFCLAAALCDSLTGAWLKGHSLRLEEFLNTAMSDEFQ